MKKWHGTPTLLICVLGLVACKADHSHSTLPGSDRNRSEDHTRKIQKDEHVIEQDDKNDAEIHISKKIDQLLDKAIRRIQDATDRAITNIENATDRAIRDIDAAGDRANKRIRIDVKDQTDKKD